MSDYKIAYERGRTDNTKRLQIQLDGLSWWEFSKRSAVKSMISISIITDYQESMSRLKRQDMVNSGMIMSIPAGMSINDLGASTPPSCI